jgi:hypothetical protein
MGPRMTVPSFTADERPEEVLEAGAGAGSLMCCCIAGKLVGMLPEGISRAGWDVRRITEPWIACFS